MASFVLTLVPQGLVTSSYLTDGAKLYVLHREDLLSTSSIPAIRTSQSLEWLAIHTWSRHEKSVCHQLRGKQIETLLPLYRSQKRWKNGQKATVELPLFPGYLFARVDLQNQLPVLQTPGVVKFVGFGRKPVSLSETEIEQLKIAATHGASASPHPYLTVGDRVRIKCGPFLGMPGILLREKHGVRVVLSVELISRSISVELDAADVEPI